MNHTSDVQVIGARLYFLPVATRMPLKFGPEALTQVTCARACLGVRDRQGRVAWGWGETPLSVQWVWPSQAAYEPRHAALKAFCRRLTEAWAGFEHQGHALEIGWAFQQRVLEGLRTQWNREQSGTAGSMPWLAALVCCSVFDQALHDAYGRVVQRPVYQTYNRDFLNTDLQHYFGGGESEGEVPLFRGKYPEDYLVAPRRDQMPAWHLVGGLDPLTAEDLTGEEPDDGYPVLLADWIRRDGLRCLKIKLRGTDAEWDYARLMRVGQIALHQGVEWLTADFNCTVLDPEYVNQILDRLRQEAPALWHKLVYVEQPFPYELEEHRIDVHSVAERKPLFLDESAHDWRLVRLGRELGWNGVALKTCKTQTGALLAGCWAQAHGMQLMVQDLTNPMLAQIPHLLLAAHLPTLMGVETNSMQFYPEASRAEAAVHPGIYRRREGQVDLSSIRGPGFGYRVEEIGRELPETSATFGEAGVATS